MTYLYGVTQAACASSSCYLGVLRFGQTWTSQFGVLVFLSALLLSLATQHLEIPLFSLANYDSTFSGSFGPVSHSG